MFPTVTKIVCSVGAPVVHVSEVPDVHVVVTHEAAPITAEGVRLSPPKLLPKTVNVAPPVIAALPTSCEAMGASNEKPADIVPHALEIVTVADGSVGPVTLPPRQCTEVSDVHEEVAQTATAPRIDDAE